MIALKVLGFLVVEYVLFVAVGPALFAKPASSPWVNDVLYPAAVTLLLTGGGAVALYVMNAPPWLVIVGFVVMLACSAFAALAGRFLRASLVTAGFSVAIAYGAVVAGFLATWSPTR